MNNGSISFLGVLEGNQYKVLKYDLMTTPANLLGSYLLYSTPPKRILIYQNYLIVYADKSERI
jgi:hypothetical protein